MCPRPPCGRVDAHPARCYEDPANPADTTGDWHRAAGVAAERPHTVSFAGHLHTTEHHYLGRSAGFLRPAPHHHHVLTAASGSWWSGPARSPRHSDSDSRDGSPNGFHVLSIDGNRYETRFVAAEDHGARALRVMIGCDRTDTLLAPSASRGGGCQLSRSECESARLLVNVFDGGPRTRVTLEIEGRTGCSEMARDGVRDPYVAELFVRHPEACKPWVSATPSSIIWTAPLPAVSRSGRSSGPHPLPRRIRQDRRRASPA